MSNSTTKQKGISKPDWLKIKLPSDGSFSEVRKNIVQNELHTICQSGNCPNMAECWGAGTATLMILGNVCTRSCQFCNVVTGQPEAVDITEPYRVAQSIKKMGLKHVVLTSVDRDDLKDGGSNIWAATIRMIRKHCPGMTIETLIPDFQGKTDSLDKIVEVSPEVVSHNLETVERLSRQVRIQARFDRSLKVLDYLKKNGIHRTKTGIMLGLGETKEELLHTMDLLREVNCDVLTLGQYLQPSKKHLPVSRYIHPDEFKEFEEIGLEKGFMYVESGPLVRSSYHAEKHVK